MTYALVNMGHRDRNPRADHASLRILGTFDNIEALKEHAKMYPSDVDVFAVKCGESFVCMKNIFTDESAHIAKLIRDNKTSVSDHVREFNENVTHGKSGDNIMPNESESMPIIKDKDMSVLSLSKSSELSGQTAAIISVIRDVNELNLSEQQPGFIIWSSWQSVDDARSHVRNDMAQKDQSMTFDVVLMYQWLCPSKIDLNNVEEEFHDDELTKIIAHRKSESSKVNQYRTICEGKGVEPCLHDVDRNLIFGSQSAVTTSVEFNDPIVSSLMA
jgi:hypothetical protein